MMKTLFTRPLHLQVKEALSEEITRGEWSTVEMLPPETELCERLGVSRSTVRRAVTALEQEGFLKRRQGIGTIIDRNVSSMSTRMDLKIEFSDLLARAGYVPEVRFLGAKEEPADEQRAGLLRIEPGAMLLSVTKLWLADDRPAILCTDMIPTQLILRPCDEAVLHQDIFTVLRVLCDQEVDYQIATLVPQCLDAERAQIFGAEPQLPIVAFEGVGYNFDGVPIICNTESYAPGILTFSLLRAKV